MDLYEAVSLTFTLATVVMFALKTSGAYNHWTWLFVFAPVIAVCCWLQCLRCALLSQLHILRGDVAKERKVNSSSTFCLALLVAADYLAPCVWSCMRRDN